MRLYSGRPDPGDEDYEPLLDDPPGLADTHAYFRRGLDDLEARVAASRFRTSRQEQDGDDPR